MTFGLLALDLDSDGLASQRILRLVRVLQQASSASGSLLSVWSLNDEQASLDQHPGLPEASLRVGGGGRRAAFFRHLLRLPDRVERLVVAHPSLAPMARTLQLMGKVGHYDVLLSDGNGLDRRRVLVRSACRHADKLVAPSCYQASNLGQRLKLPASNLTVIPPCVPPSAMTLGQATADPTPSGLPVMTGHYRILSCGVPEVCQRHLEAYESLIRSIPTLLMHGVDAHLHLLNMGSDQPRLQMRVASAGVTDQVHFHSDKGILYRHSLMSQCDVFALPTGEEASVPVFLEAMRHGKACVATTDGSLPELIQHGTTGLLVPRDDPFALGQTLARLHDDPDLAQHLGLQGQILASTRHSLVAYEQAVLDLLQQPSRESASPQPMPSRTGQSQGRHETGLNPLPG